MRRGKEGEKREKGEKVGSVHSLEMEVVALIGHRGAEMVDTVGHHVATTGHYWTLLRWSCTAATSRSSRGSRAIAPRYRPARP